jgi:hypothetical protein
MRGRHEIVFRPAPASGELLTAWLSSPARGTPLARDTLARLVADVATHTGGAIDEQVYRYAIVASDTSIVLDAYGGHCNAPGVDVVWELLDLICERTGWVAYDPQAHRIVFGAAAAWATHALAVLEARGAIVVVPARREVVLRILRKIGGYFRDDPETAVAELIVFAEIEPAIEELFGEATELIAVLQTLS